MKRIFTVALSLVMLLGLALSLTGCKDSGTKGLLYRVSDNGEYAIFVGAGEATDEDLVISDTFEGKPVTEIATGAVSDAHVELPYKSITIPASVTKINYKAIDVSKAGFTVKYQGTPSQFKQIDGSNNIERVVCLG